MCMYIIIYTVNILTCSTCLTDCFFSIYIREMIKGVFETFIVVGGRGWLIYIFL